MWGEGCGLDLNGSIMFKNGEVGNGRLKTDQTGRGSNRKSKRQTQDKVQAAPLEAGRVIQGSVKHKMGVPGMTHND